MRLLGFLVLICLAALAASYREGWERGAALGMPDFRELNQEEEDIKTELGKWLIERLKKIHRITNKQERALSNAMEFEASGVSMKDMLENVWDMLKNRMPLEKIKEYMRNFKETELGKTLLEIIYRVKDHDLLKPIIDVIKKLLNKGQERRSIKEQWEKLKEYFKDLHVRLKEKFGRFGEWMKEKFGEGLAVTKDKVGFLKEIAEKFVTHSKDVSREIAVEALEFLRPYKEDLGALWDQVKDSVKEIVTKKD